MKLTVVGIAPFPHYALLTPLASAHATLRLIIIITPTTIRWPRHSQLVWLTAADMMWNVTPRVGQEGIGWAEGVHGIGKVTIAEVPHHWHLDHRQRMLSRASGRLEEAVCLPTRRCPTSATRYLVAGVCEFMAGPGGGRIFPAKALGDATWAALLIGIGQRGQGRGADQLRSGHCSSPTSEIVAASITLCTRATSARAMRATGGVPRVIDVTSALTVTSAGPDSDMTLMGMTMSYIYPDVTGFLR